MNVYEIITQRILDKLAEGVVPWVKPWAANIGKPCSYASKHPYRGINLLLLAFSPYSCPYWATFKQVKEAGGYVKEGEKSVPIVCWKEIEREEGEEKPRYSFFARYYRVFNIEQTTIEWTPNGQTYDNDPIQACDQLVDGYTDKPEIGHGHSLAAYSPMRDKIIMPWIQSFVSSEEYYSTLFHELVHSTGARHRIDRQLATDFATDRYSREELIAEIGAGFLCAMAGIENKTLDNTASYINSWIDILKADHRIVVSAASHAQKAVDYITKQSEVQHDETGSIADVVAA
jgi:antirestriction protein ArdC